MRENPVIPQQEQAPRNAIGQLMPGAKLNPNGRPRGSGGGIQRTFAMLFNFMNEPEVQARIRAALRKESEEHPYRFARQYILPLTPYKQRKALREQIRAAEQAAYDKAVAPFPADSETSQP